MRVQVGGEKRKVTRLRSAWARSYGEARKAERGKAESDLPSFRIAELWRGASCLRRREGGNGSAELRSCGTAELLWGRGQDLGTWNLGLETCPERADARRV